MRQVLLRLLAHTPSPRIQHHTEAGDLAYTREFGASCHSSAPVQILTGCAGQVKWPKVPFCKRILPVHPHRLIHEHWCAARMLTSFSLLVIQRCIPHRRTQCKVTCTKEHTWEAVPVRGAPLSNQCARIMYVHASEPEVRREGYCFSSDRRREGNFSSPLD